MKLKHLSTSDLLNWYLFFDSQLDKLAELHEDIPDEEKTEIIESQSGQEDIALKMVYIAKLLHDRSGDIDFGINYSDLGDIELEEDY